MLKTAFCKAGVLKSPAFFISGWLAFFASFFVNDSAVQVILQAIARILP